MTGISFPDRQGVCSGCGRILTLASPRTTTEPVTIRCPGNCDGVATLPTLTDAEKFIADHFVFATVGFK